MRIEKEIIADIDNCKRRYPHKSMDQAKLYEELCLLYLRETKLEQAYEAAQKYTFYAFVNDTPYIGFPLYSFRSISDYSLSDIFNGEMSFANPEQFNDPFDTVIKNWIKQKIIRETNSLRRDFYYLLSRTIQFIRVRCFVPAKTNDDKRLNIEDVSPLMWAHYADSHKGFCAEYEISKDFVTSNFNKYSFTRIGKIQYAEQDFCLDQLKYSDALLWKNPVWSYENEIRVIDLDYNFNREFKTLKAPKLKAVYLGLKCSSEDEQKLKRALNSECYKNTKLFRMELDYNNFMKIKARRIW